MSGVAHGFTSGLNLMQDAMRLGPDAPTKLRKPVYEPPKKSLSKSKALKPASLPKPESTITDITFRSLAEDVAAQNDLVFFPVGRSHDQTGKPLFKVSKSADGRGGVTVYVGTDAVFAQTEDGTFKAVSLEDMVKRALL
jgi:tuftelin-interacting protein 11